MTEQVCVVALFPPLNFLAPRLRKTAEVRFGLTVGKLRGGAGGGGRGRTGFVLREGKELDFRDRGEGGGSGWFPPPVPESHGYVLLRFGGFLSTLC